MNTIIRIGLTILVIVALVVTVYVLRGNSTAQIVAAVAGIVMIAAIWMVKKMGDTSALANQNSPDAINKNSKRLIAIIKKNFNAMGIEAVGKETQELIIDTMKGYNSGKFSSIKKAVSTLKRVPPSKFTEARDVGYMAGTLASFYILSDEESDAGFKTRQRIDNFIAGIDDQNV